MHLFISNEPNDSRIFLECHFLNVSPFFRDLPPFWMKYFNPPPFSTFSNFSTPPFTKERITLCRAGDFDRFRRTYNKKILKKLVYCISYPILPFYLLS